MESLSTYARQFLGKMAKPECDYIKGLPPAIAIEQKVNTRNPRSTVGTSTEIYDYLRLLYGRIGKTYSPVSGMPVKRHTVEDIIETAKSYPEGSRAAIVSPISIPEGRGLDVQLDIYQKEGYTRIVKGNQFIEIAEMLEDGDIPASAYGIDLLIDRLAIRHSGDELNRLADSSETAFLRAMTLWRYWYGTVTETCTGMTSPSGLRPTAFHLWRSMNKCSISITPTAHAQGVKVSDEQ